MAVHACRKCIDVARVVQRAWVGARLIRLSSAGRAACCGGDHLERMLADHGFQLVVPSRRRQPSPVPLRGRHVAVVISRHDQAEEAARLIRELTSWSPRGHVVIDRRRRQARRAECGSGAGSVRHEVACAVRSLLACRLDDAEARLSGLEIAAALRGLPVVPRVRALAAVLRLCQGRFEEARRQLEALPAGLGRPVRVLVAWATFDRAALAGLACRPARSSHPVLRDDVVALLAASLCRDRTRVRRLLARPRRPLGRRIRQSVSPAGWRDRLHRLLVAEACAAAGWPAAAIRALGPEAVWRDATPLEHLLAAWLRATLAGTDSTRAMVWREIARTRAAGVRRFGLGSHSMHLLHAVPDLLHQVNEADDELAALGNACRWVQRECQAEAVGFLDLAQGAVLAGGAGVSAGLSAHERRELAACDRVRAHSRPDGVVVSAPVRYAGVRIGVIVIVGPGAREATMMEAASSVAALCAPAVRARLDAIALRGESHARTPEILGRSPAMSALREAIARAAGSPFPVLIEGESGSGKELVARAIHRLSPRRDRRFAALNCAALTDELAETELFGHARGAFTGAIGARVGLFEEAHLGTLFLDEAAELSSRTQARLLRALQEREVRRLGENTPRAVDVRIVAASNRPLAQLVADGHFREDLLFRMAVIRIGVPALRERPEDVPLLAVACWRRMAAELSIRAILGPDALARLARYAWPGNVRELQNVMAALAVSAPARGRISGRHVEQVLAQAGRASAAPVRSLDSARAECERRTVAAALARHGGRRAAAARELGLSRQGLAKAIKRLHLELRMEDPPVMGVA